MNSNESNAGVALFLMIAVANIALFSFLAVAVWLGARRKEREAYYRAETMKRVIEAGGERSPVLDYLREQERNNTARRSAGFKLGGLVNLAIGLALMILLHTLVQTSGVYLAGLFPLFLGLALLGYGAWVGPKTAV